MKRTYLMLAIVGAGLPYLFFGQHFLSEGLGLSDFISAIIAPPAAAGFTADLLVSSVVFWLAMFVERRRNGGPNPALYIALNMLIGLSCALPAYLYARESRTG
jgi:hypothetical protein